MLDQHQQYKQYLESIKLIQVPLYTTRLTAATAMADTPSNYSVTGPQGLYIIIVLYYYTSFTFAATTTVTTSILPFLVQTATIITTTTSTNSIK